MNNMVSLHPLTTHITPSYTHKMANVLTSFQPMYFSGGVKLKDRLPSKELGERLGVDDIA